MFYLFTAALLYKPELRFYKIQASPWQWNIVV